MSSVRARSSEEEQHARLNEREADNLTLSASQK